MKITQATKLKLTSSISGETLLNGKPLNKGSFTVDGKVIDGAFVAGMIRKGCDSVSEWRGDMKDRFISDMAEHDLAPLARRLVDAA
jgi:hypothetical protein